jgi:hypothetical protein
MTTPNSPAAYQQAAVDAALVVLKSTGLSLDDLTAAPRNRAAVPTFADYVPVGHQNASRGTRAMTATGTYVRAGLPEVTTALAVLTGEPHPLAPEGPRTGVSHS